MPLTPKSFVVVTVPCLRSPMPWEPPLPALVLPEMLRHIESSTLTALPASIRMPGRTPESGAATVLFWIFARTMPVASRAVTRMPLPSVWLMLLLRTFTVRLGVSDVPKVELVPAPMPWAAKVLLATMTLLLTSAVTFAWPNEESAIALPVVFVIGLATVPLLEMLKLPCPLPLTTARMPWLPIRFAALAPATWLPVIAMTLVPLPEVPKTPAGPDAFPLPP